MKSIIVIYNSQLFLPPLMAISKKAFISFHCLAHLSHYFCTFSLTARKIYLCIAKIRFKFQFEFLAIFFGQFQTGWRWAIGGSQKATTGEGNVAKIM